MNTEQKARAYDKVREKIALRFGSNIVEEIFSEFEMSKDERIRKELIGFVKSRGGFKQEYIAWLEKQSEPIDKEKVLIGARKNVALSIINYLDNNSVGMCLSNIECKDLENAVIDSKWDKVYAYMKKKLENQGNKPQGKSALSFDRRFLDEERGKYAAKKLLGIAIEEYKQSLWKPADSDDLPEIDREVIALLSNRKVVYAHRPKEYWDGKNIATGKVTRYYPKRYDKGGWNQPDVKWWLDLDLPKMQE